MDLLDARISAVYTTSNTCDVVAFSNAGGSGTITGIACDADSFQAGQYVQIARPDASTGWRVLSGSGGGSGMWRD